MELRWSGFPCPVGGNFPNPPPNLPPNKITKVTIQEVLNTFRYFFKFWNSLLLIKFRVILQENLPPPKKNMVFSGSCIRSPTFVWWKFLPKSSELSINCWDLHPGWPGGKKPWRLSRFLQTGGFTHIWWVTRNTPQVIPVGTWSKNWMQWMFLCPMTLNPTFRSDSSCWWFRNPANTSWGW